LSITSKNAQKGGNDRADVNRLLRRHVVFDFDVLLQSECHLLHTERPEAFPKASSNHGRAAVASVVIPVKKGVDLVHLLVELDLLHEILELSEIEEAFFLELIERLFGSHLPIHSDVALLILEWLDEFHQYFNLVVTGHKVGLAFIHLHEQTEHRQLVVRQGILFPFL